MKIEVFSKAKCPLCNTLKEYLKSENIQFEELRVDEDDKAMERVRNMGVQSLPVTVVNEDDKNPILGFDMNRLEKLA